MNFCVLGAGAWGTAMSVYLSKRGHVVTLCPRRMDHALQLSSDRRNRDYLPGIEFPCDLQIGREMAPALMEADYVFFACPSHALRKTAEAASRYLAVSPQLKGSLALCKGLEPETNKYAHEVMSEAFGGKVSTGYLTGPSHAHELAEWKPAAMCLAIDLTEEATRELQEAISSSTLRLYRSEDLTGAAIGGCLKMCMRSRWEFRMVLHWETMPGRPHHPMPQRNDRTRYPSRCEERYFCWPERGGRPYCHLCGRVES